MAIKSTTLNYNPNLPVYAEPETSLTNVHVDQKDSGSYIDPATATVEGRVTGLLNPESALNKQAIATTAKTYSGRGLLNSSMMAGDATEAVMNKAIEIATPDANTYATLSAQAQKADQDAALNNQVAQLDYQKAKNNAAFTGALTTQEQKGSVELQKLTDTAQLQRVEVDNLFKQQMNWDTLDAEAQKSLLQVQQAMGAELTGSIERILRDTNVENKTEAISALMTQYRTQLSTAGAIAGISISW